MPLLTRGRGRSFGAFLVLVFALIVVAPDLSALRPIRFLAFDFYQLVSPRTRLSGPAVVVEIDDTSLSRHGQWPWPRTLLVELLEKIARGEPSAIGIDILMPEPDRLSPERLAGLLPDLGPELTRRLASLESHDARLARALEKLPAVLAIAGVDQPEPGAAPITRGAPVLAVGGDPLRFVRRFKAALQTVEVVRRAVAEQGLTNVEADGRVVRRVSLVSAVGDTIVPSLGIALLRVGTGTPVLTLSVGANGVDAVILGNLVVPTQADGTVWLRFTPHDPARFFSAADVLGGRVDVSDFKGKLVIVGVTAIGLGDYHPTPVAPLMPGPEIHAQLIESIFDGDLLRRPLWAPLGEAVFTAVAGLVVILVVPASSARTSLIAMVAVLVLAPALGLAAYRYAGLLFDSAVPVTCLTVVFTGVLGVTLADTQRQRRALRRALEHERIAAARIAGELEAARRVQMSMLPDAATAFPGETRFDLYAYLAPAREVGGDLYDFFALDERRLFFMVGDVSGKGVAGSVFMVISRALSKSIALRRHDAVDSIVSESNSEMSRDNPEAFFVTACEGILDADTGTLTYCNAGHETPLVVASGGTVRPLAEGGGPPLCVAEDFPYAPATYQMNPGEAICLVTDGVTEAMNARSEFYGRERLLEVLATSPSGASAAKIGETVRSDVERFVAGNEQSDDMAILVVQWNGPRDAVSAR